MSHFYEALERIRDDSRTRVVKGRRFERLIRAALWNHPGEYGRARFAHLWLWQDWPDRDGSDIGIDIVGQQTEEYGGGLCAIQCKFYDNATVSTRGIESFLSAAAGDRWKARILVATTGYSLNATKKLLDSSTQVISDHDLDAWPVGDWRQYIDDPESILFDVARHEPRTDQQQALDSIRKKLFDPSAVDRGRLILPCGTGKSVVALWAAEANVKLGGRVLYLVPSIALMGQTMREWAAQRHPDITHRYLGVCSDVRAGRSSEDADLTELAMPVTTDVASIVSELKRESPETLTVVFSTYQSLPRIAEAQHLGVPGFDLVICDEAHRTTGVESDHKKDEGRAFTMVHNGIDACKRLYMTATQRIYTEAAKGKARDAGADFYSMDDVTVYGPILHEMSFGAAVKKDLLTDYEVVVIGVDEQSGIEHLSGYWKHWTEKTSEQAGSGSGMNNGSGGPEGRTEAEGTEAEVADARGTKGPGAKSTNEKAKAKAKAKSVDTQDWIRLLGCWDALADPYTVGVQRNRPTGTRHPLRACRRAIAFTNTIKASRLVEEHWRGVVEWTQSERAEQYRGHDTLALDVVHIDGQMNAYDRSKHLGWLRQARVGQVDGDGNDDDERGARSSVGQVDGDGNDDDERGARSSVGQVDGDGNHGDEEFEARSRVGRVDGDGNDDDESGAQATTGRADGHVGARVLTNARCLTEGVDVPALDAVLFMAPKRSDIDIVQAVGRVMRRSEGKHKGYIVLPVLVPSGLTMVSDEVLRGTDFDQVWRVLRALRAHDERLDTYVNSVKLAQQAPITIIDPADSGAEDGTDTDRDTVRVVQQSFEGLLPEVASVLVDKVGDRQYWPRWGKSVAEVTRRIEGRISELVKTDDRASESFIRFRLAMGETLHSEEVSEADLIAMLAQHIATLPVFEALFRRWESTLNPISWAMKTMLAELVGDDDSHGLGNEIESLARFYDQTRLRLGDISDSDARLEVLDSLYESFFKHAMPEATGRLGIVYTPVEIVDFILRSADAVCLQEFGLGLTNSDVHVLDPFTGTGTFLNRLLTIGADPDNIDTDYLITDSDLDRKFGAEPNDVGAQRVAPDTERSFRSEPEGQSTEGPQPELHANEIVPLAYYIASLKIEEAYRQRSGATGAYQPFRGLALVDTFHEADPPQQRFTAPGLADNSQRVAQRRNLPLRVIVGNPPWSAGQKSAGDNAANTRYDKVAQRVRETYGAKQTEVTGRSAGGSASGNLYVQAIRWASDRLDNTRGGIVAFVHPNSLTDGVSLAGMRAAIREEFTSAYVLNLRGDAYKQGTQFELEGAKVFGSASRNGVQITVLVRNPNAAGGGLRYAETPDRARRSEKLAWLSELGDVTSARLTVVPDNAGHDWRNLSDASFEHLLPVYATGRKAKPAAFDDHASGVKTNLDHYVYSFSRTKLIERVQILIDEYEYARRRVQQGLPAETAMASTSLSDIKWTDTLKQSLRKNRQIVFDESRIRQCLYRPFVKLWLYEDARILSSVKTISAMFGPDDVAAGGGVLITCNSNKAVFGTVATTTLPDLCGAGTVQASRFVPRTWRRS